jgi:protein SCO1/2
MTATESEPLRQPLRQPDRRGGPPIGALVVAAIVVGLVAAFLLAPRFTPHLYAGTVLQQDEPAPSLDGLWYASGQPVDLAEFDGAVALVFFGYTNCPDVCPMTLSTVSRALDQLPDDRRSEVTTLMVSVDPERDDLDGLQQYVGFFDPSFRGVGGSSEAIERAATRYGVFYQVSETERSDGAYLVDHTASLMGIGPDGSLRVVWGPDVTADALADDLKELLK